MAPPALNRLAPLALADWPAADQAAWTRLFGQRKGLFDGGGEGLTLSPRTVKLYKRGYGIWLGHLGHSGQMDPTEPPALRATPSRLDAWIVGMQHAGRMESTVRLYLTVLHAVLRLMAPTADVAFILKPRGVPLSTLMPSRPKPFMPCDTEDVMRHVRALHRTGLEATSGFARRTALRDAAIMALLLRRAPRVSSVAAMRLGEHLHQQADGLFTCSFPASDTKAARAMAWPLDRECSALMADYLRAGRGLFDGARTTDHLWLGNHGRALDVVGLQGIFMRRTQAWLGEAMGPHVARKWLRSTAARRSPEAAFDAAEVMDHSPQVSLKHYTEAQEIGAAQRHARHLRQLRQQTAGLAQRSYQQRAPDRETTEP